MTAGPQAVAQKPSFPAETEIVTVDVVVLSRAGEAVPDLRREDFTVSEDGVRQEVVAFEAVHRPAPLPGAPGPRPGRRRQPALRASTNRATPGPEPATFVIVFDELHLDSAEAERGRRAVADFLETGTADGDLVALVGTAAGTRWTARMPEGREALLQALARLQGKRVGDTVRDAMTEYEAMRIDQERDPIVTDQVTRRFLTTGAIRRDVAASRGARRPTRRTSWPRASRSRSFAAQVYARASARSEQSLGLVERSLEALGEARGTQVAGARLGRPHPGPAPARVPPGRDRLAAREHGRLLPRRARPGGRRLRDCRPTSPCPSTSSTAAPARESTRRARGARAARGSRSTRAASSSRTATTSRAGLARIGREARSYYLVGYAPQNRAADGKFRKIEVKVAREDVSVRARRGYFAPGRDEKGAKVVEARDAAIQRALDAPFDLPEVPLRAIAQVFGEAAPGQASVLLTVEADIRGLAFAEKDGVSRDTLELLLLVAQPRHRRVHALRPAVRDGLPEGDARAVRARRGSRSRASCKLGPGPYQAKIVTRDQNSGRLGSLTHDFEVPAPTGLRVSSLVLSDRLREEAKGGRPGARGAASLRSRRDAPLPVRGVRRGEGPRDRPARA